MKRSIPELKFGQIPASKQRTVRQGLILLCLLALIGVQRASFVSPTVDARSSEASADPSLLQSSSTCIAGSLAAGDTTFRRPNPSGPPFSCPGSAPIVRYDTYEFDLTGCASSAVTINLCDTGGCPGVSGQNLDTIIYVYRAGGAPHPFNPGTPCVNLVAVNDDASPGCAAGGGLSRVTTTLGPGRFQVVVCAFSATLQNNGLYNLFVNAPGCTLTQVPACPVVSLSPTTISCGTKDTPYPSTTISGVGGAGPYTFTHSGTLPIGMTFDDPTATLSGTPSQAGGFSLTVNTTDANGCTGSQTYLLVISDVTLPCITDGLCPSDPTFHPANTRDTDPTGIDHTGPGGLCRPSLVQTNTFYKAYEFNIAGCASGTLTATLCGSTPCDPLTGTGALANPVIYLYRTGGLTGPGGAPGAFNPASPCDNLVAANNDLDAGTPSSGGLAACSANTSLAGLQRTIGSGTFVLVVTSFSNGATGAYRLSVTAPGCTVGTCTAISGTVSGGGTICSGSSSTVSVSFSGGTPPYTATLDNGGGTQTGTSPLIFTVSPAITTTYSVTSATDSGGCPANVTGSATVMVNQPPTPATVGGPQTICSGGTTTGLGGNMPSVGTGVWSVVSGGAGTFSPDASTPNATFTHTAGAGPIVLQWTISSPGCPDSFANVMITINQATTATVGGPQTICANGTTSGLGGNAPAQGTASWSIVSGGTGTFNPSASTPNATFTHTGGTGPVVVRWTISNPPCPDSTADVTITINQPPTVSNAGPNQDVCGTTATLAGNTPSVGTGMWSLVSGTGSITNPSSPTTTVTGLGVGPNVFRWTISNSPCPDSTDDVTITRDATPPTALCKNITVALNAAGTASITGSQVDNGSSDNCGIGSLSVAPDTFTCANKGPNTVTLTVTDVSGNSSQCTATVTIIDNLPPSITCPANVTATAAPGQPTAVVTYASPSASDNCPGVTTACTPPSGSAFPLGTTTVTCTATDTSLNQANCTFTVTVAGAIFGNADSFLRDGADNTNEGANNLLRIQSSGHNRVVVRFDLTGVSTVGLQSATLLLNITDNSDNWGSTGRFVDAHRLLASWTEGNGHTVGDQPNFRGTGEGVTWNCAKDSNIANQNDDCVSQWNGGTFAAATASPVLHTNGQMGDVSWNVTADVLAGAANGWVIKKQNEGLAGQVKYYSKEGAAVAGNPNLGPRLVLVYNH